MGWCCAPISIGPTPRRRWRRSSTGRRTTGVRRSASSPRSNRNASSTRGSLPLRTLPIPDLAWARLYAHWLAHSTDDHYWRSLSINRRYDRIDVPAFIVGGWYDVFIRGTLENYVGLRARGRPARLLVGPWAH